MARNKNGKKVIERAYKILEQLRKNTDKDHTTTSAKIAAMIEDDKISTDTRNEIILTLADLMNDDGKKDEKDWRIVFDWYTNKYVSDDENEKQFSTKGLYYNHIFSYEEIDALIEGVRFLKTLDTAAADRIIKKITENLTTKFYKAPTGISRIRETVLADRDLLRENLFSIQRAIEKSKKISFTFNSYNKDKKLEPVGDCTLSPYYIVANDGRYYLIGAWDSKKMAFYRIDLMTDLEITDEKALNKKDIKGLPQIWEEDFTIKHLNMSFDDPVTITLKISKDTYGKPGFTFLYNSFGDTFTYVKEADGYDIVRVRCSPYGMANWAMQYSDRVEVLEPQEVRDSVIEKVKAMNEKYGIKNL